MAEAMGGKITVESELGKGSKFIIRIPLAVDESKCHECTAPDGFFDGKRALIVDDNEVNRRILTEQLASWELASDAYDCANDAIAALRKRGADAPYTIAIIDFQMPDIDGVALAKHINADATIADTPMILLTSAGRKGDPAQLADDLFAGYLVKPARASMLLDTIISTVGDAAINEMKRVSAPPKRSANAGAQSRMLQHASGRPLQVLVAEDNSVNQMVIKAMLQKFGCETTIAVDGAQAVAMYAKNEFDIVLMDVSMPVMDGVAATAEIRKEQEQTGNTTAIIGVTAHAMREDRDRCIDAGMNDYLPKPVKEGPLHDVIVKWADVAKAAKAS